MTLSKFLMMLIMDGQRVITYGHWKPFFPDAQTFKWMVRDLITLGFIYKIQNNYLLRPKTMKMRFV